METWLGNQENLVKRVIGFISLCMRNLHCYRLYYHFKSPYRESLSDVYGSLFHIFKEVGDAASSFERALRVEEYTLVYGL